MMKKERKKSFDIVTTFKIYEMALHCEENMLSFYKERSKYFFKIIRIRLTIIHIILTTCIKTSFNIEQNFESKLKPIVITLQALGFKV